MTIGFIGLGKMGAAMAPHLVGAGYQVVGHDLDPPRKLPAGLEFSPDLAALTRARRLSPCCRTRNVVEAVIASMTELGCRADIIDMSSSHPDVSRRLYAELTSRARSSSTPCIRRGARTAELQIRRVETSRWLQR